MKPPADQNPGTLCLPGSLEIYDAETVRRALLEELAAQPELRLDLRHIERCDAAGAQLLWSARRTAAQAGKPVRFEHVTPAILECWAALGMPADFFANPSPSPV